MNLSDETNGNELFYVSNILDLIVTILLNMYQADDLKSAWFKFRTKHKLDNSPILGVINNQQRGNLFRKYLGDSIVGAEKLKSDLLNDGGFLDE